MKRRHLIHHFIFVAILLSGGLPLCAQPDPASTWWYPFGPPEASRTNDVATGSQQSDDLRIKWRTTELKNSPVLLVGALRREDGAIDQQIVGNDIGTTIVALLTSGGFIDTLCDVKEFILDPERIRLTGLFNSRGTTVNPTGIPDVVGIGVEQFYTPDTKPYALLVDVSGGLRNLIGLTQTNYTQLDSFENDRNKYVTIYPVAAYTPPNETQPIALSVVSQERFVRDSSRFGNNRVLDRMLNGLRRYSLLPGQDQGIAQIRGDTFLVTPLAYHSAPAFRYDTTSGTHLISLSTERYAFAPEIISFTTTFGKLTQSNAPSPVHLRIPDPPNLVSTVGISSYLPLNVDAVAGFFLTMTVDNVTGATIQRYRVAYDERESHSGGPTMRLAGQNEVNGEVEIYESAKPGEESGFSIVPADVDGHAPGYPDVGTEYLVNNPGQELVATTYPLPTTESERNWAYIFRFNKRNSIETRAFNYITRARARGRVVASGDLVDDADGRQEFVLVWKDSLFVMQLRSYAEWNKFRNPNDELNDPFLTLARFGLGDSIVSVAIADVENDGENDLLVGTTGATYLIGTPRADAFTFSGESLGRTICPSDTISVRWKRMTIGSGEGIIVRLVGPDGSTIIPSQRVGGDSLRATPMELQLRRSGEYRVIVTDALYDYVLSESAPFTISESSIGELDFNDVASVTPGEIVRDTIDLACVPSLRLQSLSTEGVWEDVEDGVEMLDDGRAAIAATIGCVGDDACDPIDGGGRLSFRLVSPIDTGAVRFLDIDGGVVPIDIMPGDTSRSRRRTVSWHASDFAPCERLQLALSDDDDDVIIATDIDPDEESVIFSVPSSLSDTVAVCLVCVEEEICRSGRGVVVVGDVVAGNYVTPNPFDPTSSNGSGMMDIVYRLETDGRVALDIYDASRTMVRRIVPNQMRTAGDYRDAWDGRNQDGEIVANGTYICVITSSSGETIILSAVVIKQQ